eukprot:TRINITY_DN11601_c0_g1_i1.p1 TRINITY_DN11601_c0_g1~~TRINITY_DN11601_c0_g1_i1.p1  ORF type:complete len:102 (-),score=1.28 TRINITY_DN11601_c0_g1_i1:105-410(-)
MALLFSWLRVFFILKLYHNLGKGRFWRKWYLWLIAPLNLVDLVAIVPSYIELALSLVVSDRISLSSLAIIRVLRIMRILKILRLISSLSLVVRSIAINKSV